jgi:membrane protein
LRGRAAFALMMRHPNLSSTDLWRMLFGRPWSMMKGAWNRSGEHNSSLLAAGTAFYAFSSIAPVLAATVLTYGLIATPEVVSANIRALFNTLPSDVARLISQQLDTVVSGSGGKKGLGLLIALGIALYGGSKAASSMMVALDIAFGVTDKRNFVTATLTAIAMVAGGVVLMLAGVASSTVMALLADLMPWAPAFVLAGIGVGSYALMGLIAVTGVSAVFRFGPYRPNSRLRWATPGAVLATILWLGASAGFGFYVASFGNYGATYGSLSAIIVALTWLWLSVYAFLLGAELDAQLLDARPDKHR